MTVLQFSITGRCQNTLYECITQQKLLQFINYPFICPYNIYHNMNNNNRNHLNADIINHYDIAVPTWQQVYYTSFRVSCHFDGHSDSQPKINNGLFIFKFEYNTVFVTFTLHTRLYIHYFNSFIEYGTFYKILDLTESIEYCTCALSLMRLILIIIKILIFLYSSLTVQHHQLTTQVQSNIYFNVFIK